MLCGSAFSMQRLMLTVPPYSEKLGGVDGYLMCRRLLSTDPEAAKQVVLADKPVIADTSSNLEPALLDILLANLSTLASVYHKPPEVS